MTRMACVQMESCPVLEDNLTQAETLIRAAAKDGAKLIATPENTTMRVSGRAEKFAGSPYEKDHPGVSFFSALAKELRVWILVGSAWVRASEDRIANRSWLFSDTGELVARYDKIHLFDVDLPDGTVHRESDTMQGGGKAVLAQTPFGTLGLTICYDIRFPALYRTLAQAGATILCVPAAFTVPTGRAHWEILLRARAIETGSFVLAPGQTGGQGAEARWGHSLIIGPWGDVLASLEEGTGYIVADVDIEEALRVRRAIPALTHDRGFSL